MHKSPGQPHLEATLHAGERPSCVGPEQSALTEGDACAGQDEPWSRHVVKKQRLLRGMDAPPALCSENLGSLWQSSSRPLRLGRQLSLPNLFYKEHGCPGPRVAQSSALCFPSNRSATAGTQASKGAMAQTHSNSSKQPRGRSPWDGTFSLKQTVRYGIHGPSYGPCMCGRSTGAFRPPRACSKCDGRS